MYQQGLTYDDILIRPAYSTIESRSECDTSTHITEGIKLNIPIIAANMDTVCESAMAIKMALLGGVGIVHRYMTVEQQSEQIRAVKKYTSKFRTDFFSLSFDDLAGDYKRLMAKTGVKTYPVVQNDGMLAGIVTRRDMWGIEDNSIPIKEIMIPFHKLITIQENNFDEDAVLQIMLKNKIEQLPVLKNNSQRVVGLVSRKDLNHLKLKYPDKVTDSKNRLLVGAAVGVKLNPDNLIPLMEAEPDFLCIDIAHGHHSLTDRTLADLKTAFPNMPVIVGNVATLEAINHYKDKADGIKIFVGPGAACRTRVVTGCGVPEFTCLRECASDGYPYLIADGGITTSGDIVKALFGGAASVMIGSLLAATSDSPGKVIDMDGKKVKRFRGMASHEAYYEKNLSLGEDIDAFHFEAEGASGYVDYKGETEVFVKRLIQGVKSGMSYCGSRKLSELHHYGANEANFYTVSPMGFSRGGAHHMRVK